MRSTKASVGLRSLSLFLAACTSGPSIPAPAPVPAPVETLQTLPTLISRLHFSADSYRYRFTQTAEVRVLDSIEASQSAVTTRALFLVEISPKADSSFSIHISVDSVSIATAGAIPHSVLGRPLQLGTVLHLIVSPTGMIIESQLPDSLCPFGQFLGTARELVLPELPLGVETPLRRTYADTSIQHACRAGADIRIVTTRQLQDLRKVPLELDIQQRAELQGAGLLRRDSITVSGSVATRGTALFSVPNRLPTTVQTRSEGTITVTVGQVKTVFQQLSQQTLQLEPQDD